MKSEFIVVNDYSVDEPSQVELLSHDEESEEYSAVGEIAIYGKGFVRPKYVEIVEDLLVQEGYDPISFKLTEDYYEVRV